MNSIAIIAIDSGQVQRTTLQGSPLRKENFMKIKVLVVEPLKHPQLKEIDTSFESVKKIVGSGIEEAYSVAIVCNSEGKVKGLPLNRAIYAKDGVLIDIIAGTFFICGVGEDENEDEDLGEDEYGYVSLPPDMIEKYKKLFWNPQRFFLNRNGNVVVI